ncbi:hypothetical protein BU24DRAFT_225904 [Aaosphaeria arxii CBS 175.79]|uniref:Uncharacterized protein n=1 Tax=Aaosphaeria arxii CBS 175.79 TaxID=1450172 RepID=A0A6A5XRP8_9PLEO|nr:uncharacterized protein BU24DRAFT_225904 [Aaosphaeria arxii CBS 175.79]KAF2014974.1 hypothetical protein BU24DRAFT_225904 [Aaosphaeria arxii CBS 175.79]
MDVFSTLNSSQVEALSNPDTPLASTLAASSSSKNRTTDGINGAGTDFEHSLRLKNTLDLFEAEPYNLRLPWARLSILLGCEFQLYKRNEGIELRFNPFLSHWVEAISRLDRHASASGTSKGNSSGPGEQEINMARMGLIKEILTSRSSATVGKKSPRELLSEYTKESKSRKFDVGVYIRMLEEEGIYEPSMSSSDGVPTPQSAPAAADVQDGKSAAKKDWKQDLLTRLETDPESAVQDLTRLPLSLPSLDFLTTLLQDNTLANLPILASPSALMRDYIQHCLRLIESMSLPPPASTASPPHDVNDHGHGRLAQSRAVKLLLLFLRSSIRKNLVQPDELYFEIQEICVSRCRYSSEPCTRISVRLHTSNAKSETDIQN